MSTTEEHALRDGEPLVSLCDVYDIGEKIVEMADRVRSLHRVVPGSVAKWGFELDGTRFEVAVNVDTREAK